MTNKLDLGNNESVRQGVSMLADGTFMVITSTKVWHYKTASLANQRWEHLVKFDLV